MFRILILSLFGCFALNLSWAQTVPTDSLATVDSFNLQQIDRLFEQLEENWSSLSAEKQENLLQEATLYLERGLLSPQSHAQKYSWIQQYKRIRDRAMFKQQALAQLSDSLRQYSLADLQANLPDKTACLEYFWGNFMVYVFYVDQETAQFLRLGLASDQLAEELEQFRQQLSDPKQLELGEAELIGPFIQQSSALYEQLLAPLTSLLPSNKKLLIIPDGPLLQLPFEALLHQPAGKKRFDDLPYLIKDKAIFYHYSSSLFLVQQKAPPKKGGQMLAIAGSYTKEQGRKLEQLPNTRLEIGRLARQFEGRFLLDSLATEANFKASIKPYAVIHLAMHGLQDKAEPLQSGLAFSNMPQKEEDNLLMASEIMNLPISSDLVVLSACETALGRFQQGNATASLARAFMYAGTPAALVSLWQIDDESTAILLEDYYRQIAAGADKSSALQRAKLKYLSASKNNLAGHPIFWAAFVQIGIDQPLYLAEKNIGNALLFLASIFAGGIGLLLILSVIFRWRRHAHAEGIYRK